MHIRVNRDVLLSAFSHGQSVIERRTTLLILGHTLIQVRGGEANLISTDMDLSLSESFPCEVLEEGELCVPTLLLYDILRKIKANVPVDLVSSPDAAQITLSAGRSHFEIPFITAEEFPRVLQDSSEFTCHFTIPAPLLKSMLETVRFSMSTDEMRYSLVGINLSCDMSSGSPKLRAVATDRHRLACMEVAGPEGTENLPSIIIGKKTIGEMIKLLDEAVEPVSMAVSETRMELTIVSENSKAVLGSRLIDGAFPDFDAILSIQHEKKLIAGTKTFAEAVDRVGTVINEKLRMIKITLSRNLMTCAAVAGSSGSAQEDIDIDYEDEGTMEFNFDVRYLLDVAQHIDADEMEISLTNPDMAVAIRPVGVEGIFFAVMSIAPQADYAEE